MTVGRLARPLLVAWFPDAEEKDWRTAGCSSSILMLAPYTPAAMLEPASNQTPLRAGSSDDGISAHTVKRCYLPATRASSIPTLTRNVFGIKKKVIKAPIIKIPAMIYKAADRSEETSLAHIGMFGPK